MSLTKMRNKIQQESPAAKSFRKTPTAGKLIGYSVLAVLGWCLAAWLYIDGGSALAAVIPFVIGMVCALVAFDTWRQLRARDGRS